MNKEQSMSSGKKKPSGEISGKCVGGVRGRRTDGALWKKMSEISEGATINFHRTPIYWWKIEEPEMECISN